MAIGDALADTGHHVLQRPPGGVMVERQIGRQQRHANLARQIGERIEPCPGAGVPVHGGGEVKRRAKPVADGSGEAARTSRPAAPRGGKSANSEPSAAAATSGSVRRQVPFAARRWPSDTARQSRP